MDRGSMRLLLRISRLAGMAPVNYSPEFQVSRNLVIYGIVLMIFNVILTFTCNMCFFKWVQFGVLAGDTLIKFSLRCTVAVITTMALFTAKARLTRMDNDFKKLKQIDAKLQDISKADLLLVDKKIYHFFVFFGAYFFLRLVDIARLMTEWNTDTEVLQKMIVYLIFILNLFIATLLQLQISLFSQRISITLKAINNTLQNLLPDDSRANSARVRVPWRKIGDAESLSHKIREIATSYRCICQIVSTSTKADGVVMMLSLLYMTFHLEIHFYPLLAAIISNSFLASIRVIDTIFKSLRAVAVIVFVIYYIEKFHQTHSELQRTRNLITNRKSKENERAVENELELFYRMLQLIDVSYSPLSLFTMDRPLLMKLFGGVITYLVIILQYEPEIQNIVTQIQLNNTSNANGFQNESQTFV